MACIKQFAFAAAVSISAAFFVTNAASAMNLSGGAASTRAIIDTSNLVEVQFNNNRQRARPGRRGPAVVNRGRGRPVIVNRGGRNRGVGRGVAAGIGAAAAVGLVGAAIAAGSRPAAAAPYYDDPVVVVREECFFRNEELFNRNGVPRGVFQVRICR